VGETSVTAASDAPSSQDGRLTRAARTRAAVVDALLTLNERGNLRPTARDIAAEAGVSLRSLYVHFDDLEALFVAASARHAERITAVLPPVVVDGTFEERLDAFLARRATLFEVGAGVRRAALLQEPFSPTLQHTMSEARKAGRAEIRRTFKPELSGADPEMSSRLLRALEVVASAATWEALRTYQDLSVASATDQVRDMVLAYIAAWGPSDGAAGQAPTSSRSSSTPARA
jgi:AcrR family transcriptional regulator